MHIGNNNHDTNYTMNGSELSKVSHKKDLRITISNDLKPSEHCSDAIKTANKLVGFICRTFAYKSVKVTHTLFNALVRPHLEYCVQFWSPYYKKDIDKLERIQRRVTEIIPRLRNKSYEERLNELNLFSLSKHKLREDLIELLKIFHDFDNININDYVTTDLTKSTRNNDLNIIDKRSNEAKAFFLQ